MNLPFILATIKASGSSSGSTGATQHVRTSTGSNVQLNGKGPAPKGGSSVSGSSSKISPSNHQHNPAVDTALIGNLQTQIAEMTDQVICFNFLVEPIYNVRKPQAIDIR